MSVSVFFDGEEDDFAGRVDGRRSGRIVNGDRSRFGLGDGWALRFRLDASPKQETHYYEPCHPDPER